MARQPIGAMEHVGIVMEDLAAARKLFAETLRLPVVDYPDSADGKAFAARVGQTTIRVVTPGAPEASVGRKGCNHVAFQVKSLAATRERLDSLGIRTTAMQTGSGGRQALWVDPASTIGIPVQFVEKAAPLKFPAAPVDGIIERVDHLGIAAHSHALARDIFSDGFGFPIECTQIELGGPGAGRDHLKRQVWFLQPLARADPSDRCRLDGGLHYRRRLRF